MTWVLLEIVGASILYAWLVARSTMYTITSRRVVMRFGIAVPVSFNLIERRFHPGQQRLNGSDTSRRAARRRSICTQTSPPP